MRRPTASEQPSPALGFLRLVWRLNHAIEQLSKDMELKLGVTAQQRIVIRLIGSQRDTTPGQLAAQLHLDAGTISSTLARLERRGLLERRRDPHDRRRIVLRLRAAGRVIDRSSRGTVEHAVARLLAETPARHLEHAREALEALTIRLDDERR